MSKALHSQVESEIRRREIQRIKQEQERALEARKECENKIFQLLDQEFSQCLESFRDYRKHKVCVYNVDYYRNFKTTAEELGFMVEKNTPYLEAPYYVLRIPPFQKGSKRTPAQKKLLAFEQQLKKARKGRKNALLSECERIKQQLKEGNYKYCCMANGTDATVAVPSQISLGTRFEEEVVCDFFEKLKICFDQCIYEEWRFKFHL